MRAGSTLLKALLATRREVSNLPEIPFDEALSVKNEKTILVIKSPAYYGDLEYPSLPDIPSKKIILIRHPLNTILSLQKMNFEIFSYQLCIFSEINYLLSYWVDTYRRIMTKVDLRSSNTLIVRYEDLISDCILTTEKIFGFIGCEDSTGTDSYSFPTNFVWKWGSDDGGEKIKSLKIQKESPQAIDQTLVEIINNSYQIKELLNNYGYQDQ